MLFPSFYFDMYENILNEKTKEKDILKLISRSDEYVDYLKDIYIIINEKVKIPRIDWI